MNRTDLKDYLTDEERKKLVASLHHALVWVGVKEPEELLIDKSQLRLENEKFHQTDSDMPAEVHSSQGRIELHHLIWRLINELEITENERLQIEELIDILQKKRGSKRIFSRRKCLPQSRPYSFMMRLRA